MMNLTSSNYLKPPRQLWWLGLGLSAIALLLCLVYSITLGARDIPLRIILESFITLVVFQNCGLFKWHAQTHIG